MNVVCVASCMLAWTILYAWLCYMMPHKSCEWNCRIVAAFHAMLVLCLSAWSMFVQGPNPFTDPGMYSNNDFIFLKCVKRP